MITKKRTAKKANGRLPPLYESDETAWLEQTSQLIKKRQYKDIDYRNLAEYLDDMAQRDRREVFSRLQSLMMHLLKQEYQSWKRTRSWDSSVLMQKHQLQDLLESGTLKNHAVSVLESAYRRAVRLAAGETGMKAE